MINVVNLNKYYNKGKNNEIHVINNTNLVLPNTGFVVFLGASGSGKTTLINVIAGLDKAKGEISYDEATFKNYKMDKIDKFRRDNIGYVFQNYNLLPNLTVYENLRLPLELMGISDSKEVKERIEYVLDMLNIKKCKNKLASNLSGGQMQRVSIARALVKDSKIIIADEPTGNLDSENTIEVMNILKAISKNRLVIMVTHDKKNAKFYADRIVEIKDGCVEKDYENDSSDELDNFDKSKIYLKDLKNETLELNGVKINLFLEENDSLENLNLTIVKKDGSIYLKSDSIKYLNDDSKIQLIDDNYKAIKKEDVDNFEFNLKPIEMKKKKFTLKPLLHSFAEAYKNHRSSSKKMKGLHACFVIIGVVMAVCVLMLSVGTYVNKDQVDYSDIGIVYKRGDLSSYPKETEKMINEGLIIDYAYTNSITYSSNFIDHYTLTNTCYILDSKHINDSIIEGTIDIKDDEAVITKRVADAIIKKMSNIEDLNYKKLIGRNVSDKKIAGIVNSESTTVYIDTNYGAFDNMDISYDTFDYVATEWQDNYNYELISGRNAENENECIVDLDLYLYEYKDQTTVTINGNLFNIVGLFTTNDVIYAPVTFLVHKDCDMPKNNINYYGRPVIKKASLFELSSGVMPKGANEIIVSEYYVEGLNNDFDRFISDNHYEIVGRFKSNASSVTTCVGLEDNYVLYSKLKYPAGNIVLITTDDNLVINRYKEINTTFKTCYDLEHDLLVKQKKEMFGSTITVSLVFLVITLIYTFFMMRSKMIHRIYEIGVLREIGASRGRIYRMFFAELLVLISMTTMIGYLASLLLCHLANTKIHGLLNLFGYSPIYAILGFVILLGSSIIAGMLPIFTLQRKTPAEIVAKYDL